MKRFATIDVGTNSVLLLVAERRPEGEFVPVIERVELTRLGRGVDQSHRLEQRAIEETLAALERFADEARGLGAEGFAAVATSAARDATNANEFFEAAKLRTGIEFRVVSGDEEARLSFLAAHLSFPGEPLVVLDIGGGSTELIYGQANGEVQFRHSYNVGSVRLTERFADVLPSARRAATAAFLRESFAGAPPPPAGAKWVGTAGTVTTVCTLARAISPYDATRVHGAVLPLAEVAGVVDRLWSSSLDERKALVGLEPKRADIIPAGALILFGAMEAFGATAVTVNDRGLRWGVLYDVFGRHA